MLIVRAILFIWINVLLDCLFCLLAYPGIYLFLAFVVFIKQFDVTIYTDNILKKVLDTLTQELVTLLKIQNLLVAASYIVINDRSINWFDHELFLVSLDLKDLLSSGQDLNTSLDVRHLSLSILIRNWLF